MYNYAIVVHHQKDKSPQRKAVHPTDADYKTTVFQRVFNACQFKEKQRVKIRRGHRRGTVVHIHEEVEEVQWENNRPLFVAVEFDDSPGKYVMCSPNQLKKSNQ